VRGLGYHRACRYRQQQHRDETDRGAEKREDEPVDQAPGLLGVMAVGEKADAQGQLAPFGRAAELIESARHPAQRGQQFEQVIGGGACGLQVAAGGPAVGAERGPAVDRHYAAPGYPM
jgi:hypothetical protein